LTQDVTNIVFIFYFYWQQGPGWLNELGRWI